MRTFMHWIQMLCWLHIPFSVMYFYFDFILFYPWYAYGKMAQHVFSAPTNKLCLNATRFTNMWKDSMCDYVMNETTDWNSIGVGVHSITFQRQFFPLKAVLWQSTYRWICVFPLYFPSICSKKSNSFLRIGIVNVIGIGFGECSVHSVRIFLAARMHWCLHRLDRLNGLLFWIIPKHMWTKALCAVV